MKGKSHSLLRSFIISDRILFSRFFSNSSPSASKTEVTEEYHNRMKMSENAHVVSPVSLVNLTDQESSFFWLVVAGSFSGETRQVGLHVRT